jgi:hypothetical protein
MRLSFSRLLGWKSGRDNSAQPAHPKRKHTRLPFSGRATLCWTEDGRPHELRAALVNASEGGMAVATRKALPAGAQVWILLQDGTDGRAEVRYSNPAAKGYQTGLKFIAEERPSRRAGKSAQSVMEWIDASNRLVGSLVSVRNADEGELEVIVPEVVPCPAIVMLSANEVRCLCYTKDWRPDGNSYRFRIEVVSEAFPNNNGT